MHLDHALTALSLIFVMVVADKSCHLSDAQKSCTYATEQWPFAKNIGDEICLQLEVGEGPKRRHVTVTVTVTVTKTGSI